MKHGDPESVRRKNERGGTTVEAVTAIIILFFIVFAMLQIYHWCITKQVCQYSAFYTCKALALGYEQQSVMRAARVAGIAISGRSIGAGDDDEIAAEHYMIGGDGSGVSYEYWHPRTAGKSPTLSVYGSVNGEDAVAKVVLENAPLLQPALATFLGITDPPDPSGSVRAHNYSKELLEE